MWPSPVTAVPSLSRALAATGAGPRRRVLHTRPGHAYVAVRGLDGHGGEELGRAVEAAVRRLHGVHWAQVNPVLASVVVSFEDGRIGADEIAEVVSAVQESAEVGKADPELEHPADPAPIARTITALVADAVGMGVGVAGLVLRAPALPVELSSVLSALDGVPAVRRVIDGHPGVATAAAVTSAALQGLGQGPLGLVVDGAHRWAGYGEQTARRKAWLEAEQKLCGFTQDPPELPSLRAGERPEPAPSSLAERYAQASSLAALGAAGATLAATRNPLRAADMLLAGAPRAARLGVESFASGIGRELAHRGVVILDPRVLRRLDTIDTVVIDASLAGTAAVGEELYGAVRGAAHDLVVAGRSSVLAREVGPDLTVAGGTALARSVRQLQAEGRVVAVVSGRAGAGLRAADLGVGVAVPGEAHPPWGADVICLDPRDVPAVIDATRLARTAGRSASGLAAAGSLAGGLAALGPLPGAGRRAVTAVQLACLAAMGAGSIAAARLPPRSSAPIGPEPAWHALEAGDVPAALPPAGPAGSGDADDEPGRPSVGRLIAAELSNPLTAVLGVGAALSAATGSVVDAALIAGVIGMDATIGVGQRLRSEAAIARLGRLLRGGRVTVVSGGERRSVDSSELRPGDVVELAAGDAVPADARVIDAVALEVDESALTGESLPVAKDPKPVDADAPLAERSSMLYAGTAVAAGRARAVVVATGPSTEARRAGHLAAGATAPAATGVEARLKSLTDRTVPIVVAAGAGLAANSLIRGAPAREAVSSGVSLAASAVPEGLPFVATVAQAAAAHRLARSDILVRNASVLEALGRVDVLCFDKTGTLTEGRLRLSRVSDGAGDRPLASLDSGHRAVLAAALRATPRARPGGLPHPTDQAVVDGAAAAGVGIADGVPGWKKAGALPFEPGRGYHAVVAHSRAGDRLSVKGAPEVVLPRCRTWRRAGGSVVALDQAGTDQVEAEVHRLARQGLRVLAVAERNGTASIALTDAEVKDLELCGLIGVADEARGDAAEPLGHLQRAGIQIVMITGDHPSTAEAVARELGLVNGRGIMTGPELDALDDSELDRAVGDVAVFARVAPAHKVRIVAAFQRAGKVVAMTGDGANDAQAIRLAHVGVAFGSRSTPAAQAAADIVIARDDLAGLIETMVEGRAMWASVRESLGLLLGGNLGEVLFATGAALVSGSPPLTARQLLAVNLFTDLAPAMAIAVQPPRSARVHLEREGPETSLSGRLARDVAIRATATSAGAYGAWLVARATGTPTRARTVALAALVGSQLGQTLIVGRHSPLVLATSVVSAAGLVAMIQTPGVCSFFGCRPLGPAGWTIAAVSAGAATAAGALADALLPAG